MFMFLAHYLLILGIFLIYRSKIAFFGLLLGNLIDLDHLYYRIIGKVEWAESACANAGSQCSFGFYPLHNWFVLITTLMLSTLILCKDKKWKFIGFIMLGAFLNLVLDLIHFSTGIGFSVLN